MVAAAKKAAEAKRKAHEVAVAAALEKAAVKKAAKEEGVRKVRRVPTLRISLQIC